FWVNEFVWSRDSSKIYYPGTDEDARNKGQSVIWSSTVSSKPVNPQTLPKELPDNLRKKMRQVTQLFFQERITRGYDGDLAFTQDGQTLYFSGMSLERPSEIHKLR